MALKTITRCGVIAALYIVLTLAVAPIAYGPLQFRISEFLKPLALFSPWFSIAFAIGNAGANLMSPFGPWDYIAMPIVDALAAYLCWKLRKQPEAACIVQAVIISIGVSVFPLWLGGGIVPQLTFIPVLVPEIVLILGAWLIIWKPRKEMICEALS